MNPGLPPPPSCDCLGGDVGVVRAGVSDRAGLVRSRTYSECVDHGSGPIVGNSKKRKKVTLFCRFATILCRGTYDTEAVALGVDRGGFGMLFMPGQRWRC